jgi:hypothetical protein
MTPSAWSASDKINAGQKPKPLELTQRDGYHAALEEMPNDSWKTM